MVARKIEPALREPESERRPSASACTGCGVRLDSGTRFCPSCGRPSGSPGQRVSAPVPRAGIDPLLGSIIADSYVITELIAVGGMGRVYRAEQVALSRSVAIKVIHPHLCSDDQFAVRFYQEARAASALNHPNTVGVIDFGQTPDGMPYLVMEHLQGKDLCQVLHEEGPLPIGRACGIVLDVLSALGEAHLCGIVHRDLKPENVFVERLRSGRDLVKILDFGIAKLSGDRQTTAALTAMFVGTPEYMSPEQIRGDDIDGRADLYSTGMVLYELLTNTVPFRGASVQATLLAQLEHTPPSPRSVRADLPEGLERFVLRALEKDPARRFVDAAEMAAALSEVVEALGIAARKTPTPVPRSRPAERPFVGRETELRELEGALRGARAGIAFVNVTGEPGSGKTRLVRKLAEVATRAGFLSVECGPHPAHVPVGYWPIRTLLCALLDTDEIGLRELARGCAIADPFARAGIAEVLNPEGLPHSGTRPRTKAVSRALAYALDSAQQRRLGAPVLLVLEDVELIDGSSLAVIEALGHAASAAQVCVCVTSCQPLPAIVAKGARVVDVHGLTPEETRAYVGTDSAVRLAVRDDGPSVLPLFVDQLEQLGLGEGDAWPTELAQVVAGRARRCSRGAQRVLQLTSVLGVEAARADIVAMTQGRDLDAIDELLAVGLLLERDGRLAFAHSRVRDLVHASLPAAARAGLHARALGLGSMQEAPLEVRAWHALQSREVMVACVLLERAGGRALRRGDAVAAVRLFQAGWELARELSVQAFHPTFPLAVSAMSCGLARALAQCGQAAYAEGLMQEQLDLADARSVQRARVAVELAALTIRRRAYERGVVYVQHALEAARAARSPELEARARALEAALRLARADLRGAGCSFQDAYGLIAGTGVDSVLQAEVALKLGATMYRTGDLPGAAVVLMHAEAIADGASAPDMAALAAMLLGLLERARRNDAAARASFARAQTLAERAGDLDLAHRLEALRDADPALAMERLLDETVFVAG